MAVFFIDVTSPRVAACDLDGGDYNDLAAARASARSALYDLSRKSIGPDRRDRLIATIRTSDGIVAVETLDVTCSTTSYPPQNWQPGV